ncbi:hypothetical protein D9M71_446390 [compost metagenome]
MREEARHHAITHGELRHAVAYCGDDAGTIGHGDAAIGGPGVTGDDAQVVVVERAGMDPHLDLACLGRFRGGHVDQAKIVQASGMLELNGFHEGPRVSPCAERGGHRLPGNDSCTHQGILPTKEKGC